MKFTIERDQLNKGLQIVGKIISSRPSLPILSNVLLSTEKNGLRISSTDLELGITLFAPAKIEETGSFTVPARILSEFIANNTDKEILITKKGETSIEAKSNKFEAIITGIPADEFPSIPEVLGNIVISLNPEFFIQSIRQTVVACALDDIRPALAGVYFKFSQKKMKVAATDSFRLGEKIIDLETEVPEKEIIVPSRTIHEIIRIGSIASETKGQMILGENQLRFKIGQTDIVSRLIEATFPDYEKIIPTESLIDITTKTVELQTALRAGRIFSTTRSNNIKLNIEDQAVKISSLNTERGQSQTTIEAKVAHHKSDEKNLTVSYNARYLSDALNAIEGEDAVMFISGAKKPTIIRNPSDPNYQHLVMPVDIKE